jgi:PIN domain nuclease of toxin-antitoxin system
MAKAVLDSSAVLAVLNDEIGSQAVIAILDDAILSAVNYAEVISKLVERGVTLTQARAMLSAVGVTVAEFDRALAERTGELRAITSRLGLSLGDRACIALAEREGAPALTGDRRWATVACEAEIRLIR